MNAEQRLSLMSALLAELPAAPQVTATPSGMDRILGQHIVVLDRGWVYVGDVSVTGDVLRIDNARNVRKWGTTRGLGELRTGPKAATVLDDAGSVLAPVRAVIHLIPCMGF